MGPLPGATIFSLPFSGKLPPRASHAPGAAAQSHRGARSGPASPRARSSRAQRSRGLPPAPWARVPVNSRVAGGRSATPGGRPGRDAEPGLSL